jgi:metal-sulfur cluster biosynthetic enzyme
MPVRTPEQIKEYLQAVIDPELGITIVDLGLVYDVQFPTPDTVKIVMTLTSMGCPLFGTIYDDVKKSLLPAGYAPDQIEVELTFDPPWNQQMMSDRAKAEVGLL